MSTANLISEIEAQGVVFKAVENRVLFNPRDAIDTRDLLRLRQAKPEVLALVKVKQALRQGRRLKGSQLKAETGLNSDQLYPVLGELYDWYELGTDFDGYYWLIEPHIN